MTERKISVVINTYNAERTLAKVLETVKGFDECVGSTSVWFVTWKAQTAHSPSRRNMAARL